MRIGCIKLGYGWLPSKEVVNMSNEMTHSQSRARLCSSERRKGSQIKRKGGGGGQFNIGQNTAKEADTRIQNKTKD